MLAMVYYAELAFASVGWKARFRYTLPALWTFLSIYGVERLADYYYLADNSTAFFTVSGWRLPLFILFIVAGSVVAGALLRNVWRAAASECTGLVAALLSVYVLCDPRVCYSAGVDGLEPLRMGFFLVSVAVAGSALGVSLVHAPLYRRARFATAFFGFAAVGYYPVIFTFAGTKLLMPFYPLAVAILLAAAAGSVSFTASLDLGPRWGVLVPVASLLVLLVLSAGIAAAFLQAIAPAVTVMVLFAVATAAAGAAAVRFKRAAVVSHRSWASRTYALGLVLVLLMMIFVIPDAVNGVVPAQNPSSTVEIGIPVYVGAFMDAPAGHANGAGVEVTFAGTNSSSIQPDNFLSAGFGIHAAGCCVDGIDYSYRFDLYLFHDGNEALVASAWEACDDNAACGGHSWKVLMFQRSQPLLSPELGAGMYLRMEWVQGQSGASVLWAYSWAYSVPTGGFVNFTEFAVPKAENHDFNTGILPGGTLGPGQSGSYFFQFGMMSGYPIGHGGWSVELTCPSLLTKTWSCVSHAKTLAGDQSYWKVFWRWGENYPNVSEAAEGAQSIGFSFAQTSARNFEQLW